jgi:hypothetical protein
MIVRVGMIQSNYVPWRGYFDFIASVDCFVLYDDVPIGTGKKWRNRNLIKTRDGCRWLTVPIRHHSGSPRICDVRIAYETDWVGRHCGQLLAAYSRAAHFDQYFPPFREILERRLGTLSALNEALIRWVATELGINTTIVQAASLSCPYTSKDRRPIELLERIGATTYLTGPNTLSYTSCCRFRDRGIVLLVKDYTYSPYKQLWGDFIGQVSILDLLFNTGRAARRHFRSEQPDTAPPCPFDLCGRDCEVSQQ